MVMKHRLIAVLFLCLLSSVGVNPAGARVEMPVVTGENWTTATAPEKKAFLVGLVTMLSAEQNAQGARPPPAAKSLIPTLVGGLSKFDMLQIMDGIDAYYKNNPDKLRRSVLEVIWFELALPNAKAKAK